MNEHDDAPTSKTSPQNVESPEKARALIEQFQKDYQSAKVELAKVIVGHSEIIDGVLT